jgi:hypothetical protein
MTDFQEQGTNIELQIKTKNKSDIEMLADGKTGV